MSLPVLCLQRHIGLWFKASKSQEGEESKEGAKEEDLSSVLLKATPGTVIKKESLSTKRRYWKCLGVCYRVSDLLFTQHLENKYQREDQNILEGWRLSR